MTKVGEGIKKGQMKNENKSLQVQVEQLLKAPLPKIKRDDLLKAVTKIIYDKEVEKWRAKVEEDRKKFDALIKKTRKYVTKSNILPVEKPLFHSHWVDGKLQFAVEYRFKLPVELSKEYDELKNFSFANQPNWNIIANQVNYAASEREAVMKAMLSDPAIKENLEKFGEALLKQPTEEEKRNAIEVR